MELREPPISGRPQSVDVLTRWLLVTILLGVLGVWVWLVLGPRHNPRNAAVAERHREVAAKLQAAGALDEAARLYESYLDGAGPDDEKRARIAYSLGSNYMQIGQYETALRWFYEAETLGAGDLADELSSGIVHSLERLGRHHAAQAALEGRVALGEDETRHPEEDPVVARIGEMEIRRSRVRRALDSVPPEIASNFTTPEGQRELLNKVVSDELLWRKAVKLEYDQDPEVERRQTEILKQLTVARFVEKEVLDKIRVDESDLQNYFATHRDRYQPDSAGESSEEVTFEQARPMVERDYRMIKMESAYNDFLEAELSTQDVELFPEAMGDG